MKPYYQDDAVTIYHGDCMDVLPMVAFDAILTDAPYGVGIGYGSFLDTTENVQELARAVSPFVLGATRAAVFCGVPQMWMWPRPAWVLCWSIYPATNEFCSWGFSQWQPVLVYGKDPFLATKRGPHPTFFKNTTPPDRRDNAHPCPKPDPVMRWSVDRTTLGSDIICDPFMGSGTTLRAAKDLGRKAIGIEIEERYCEIAARRMQQEVLAFG
jgi:site-specific DNA-methyltransferase (adenine-specific)